MTTFMPYDVSVLRRSSDLVLTSISSVLNWLPRSTCKLTCTWDTQIQCIFYTKKYLVHVQVTRYVTQILHMYLQTVCMSVHSVCISEELHIAHLHEHCTYMQTALSTVNNLSIVIHLICCESILYSSFIFILFPCAAVSQWISPTAVQQK